MLDEAREMGGDVDGGGEGKAGANVFAFTSAISACGKSGHWEKAVSLLDVSCQGVQSILGVRGGGHC